MSDYPGLANTLSVVEEPPVGAADIETYVLWRSRVSGGWYKEATGSLAHVTEELAAEREHYRLTEKPMPTYRLVKVVAREEAMEVALP